MSNLKTKLLLLLLVSGPLACSGESGALKGKTGHAQAAAQESVFDMSRDVKSQPADERSGEATNSSPKVPADPENSVTPPQAISGTYLSCPILDETESSIDIACKYADPLTHKKIPDDSLFKSVVPKVSFPNEDIQVHVKKLPPSAAWSHLIKLRFKTKDQKNRLRPSLIVQVDLVALNDQVRSDRVETSAPPVEVTSGLGIRNLRNADSTYIGFYGDRDPNVLSDRAIGAFRTLNGVHTNWKLDTDRKIKNPLGYCMTTPSIVSVTSLYVECEDPAAASYQQRGSLIRITSGSRAGECLTVNSIPNDFFVGPDGPRYLVGLTACNESDYNQHWDFVFY